MFFRSRFSAFVLCLVCVSFLEWGDATSVLKAALGYG